MIVRSAIPADIPVLISLDRDSPSAAQWSQKRYGDLFPEDDLQPLSRLILVIEGLGSASAIQRVNAPAASPAVVAYLAALRVDREWELENIVVAEKSRRQGMACCLLQKFLEQVRNANGNSIFLEVRESNQSARALYERFGFEVTGRRKGYYSNPAQDAILYRLVVRQFS